jgi:hypothetical protein
MAFEIFLNDIPASDVAFDEYSVDQSDLLALQIQTWATKIEVARRGLFAAATTITFHSKARLPMHFTVDSNNGSGAVCANGLGQGPECRHYIHSRAACHIPATAQYQNLERYWWQGSTSSSQRSLEPSSSRITYSLPSLLYIVQSIHMRCTRLVP